jgi:hypothetical protein
MRANRPIVMAGLGPATHDFAAFTTASRIMADLRRS